MHEYNIPLDIELADVQNTVAVLTAKLDYYKKNISWAYKEISDMEIALMVLEDIENDVANME